MPLCRKKLADGTVSTLLAGTIRALRVRVVAFLYRVAWQSPQQALSKSHHIDNPAAYGRVQYNDTLSGGIFQTFALGLLSACVQAAQSSIKICSIKI